VRSSTRPLSLDIGPFTPSHSLFGHTETVLCWVSKQVNLPLRRIAPVRQCDALCERASGAERRCCDGDNNPTENEGTGTEFSKLGPINRWPDSSFRGRTVLSSLRFADPSGSLPKTIKSKWGGGEDDAHRARSGFPGTVPSSVPGNEITADRGQRSKKETLRGNPEVPVGACT